MTPEPTDKLDATATTVAEVNGPEDALSSWHQVDWRRTEREVRRLRQRIFTASKAGDLPRVRRLQRLMLGSRSKALVSVRRVTEPFKALPVRRVYIPKPGGKRRPLGIPVIYDRAHQARVVNALEPEWEARFEPKS